MSSGIRNGNGGLPLWLKAFGWLVGTVGLPGLIALYLLGAIPSLPSPIAAHEVSLERHDQGTLRVLRMICRGIWRDIPAMAQDCDR